MASEFVWFSYGNARSKRNVGVTHVNGAAVQLSEVYTRTGGRSNGGGPVVALRDPCGTHIREDGRMAVIAHPAIERTEVDGVPVLWSAVPGPLTVALVFRVGRVDEQPPKAGITHAIEHLAMAPLDQPRYDHNAFVDATRTVFHATGRPDELTGFFGSVSRSLAALPVARLVVERDVLLREADGRGDSIAEMHRNFRFGLVGHGLVGQPEFGLAALTEKAALEWAGRSFGRGNAMAWVSGPPPAGLRFELADGERLPVPTPAPIADVRLPAVVDDSDSGAAFGFLLSRQLGAASFVSILQHRLRRRLRAELGLVYDVLGDYDPLDGTSALALVGADCAADSTQQVVDLGIAELESLARGEATDAELAEELGDLERAMEDPGAVMGLLDALVQDELLGLPYRSPEERYEEQRTTNAGHIGARAAEALGSALVLSHIHTLPAGFSAYPRSSPAPVGGREVKPFLSVLGLGPKMRLTIGPDGVSVRHGDGTFMTVRYADCVILEHPVEDELVMWGRDGVRLYVPAVFWRGGEDVLAEIRRSVPPEVVVTHKMSHDLIEG